MFIIDIMGEIVQGYQVSNLDIDENSPYHKREIVILLYSMIYITEI